jgi:hypothetical protein
MKPITRGSASIHKVRRDEFGGKRGNGHQLQKQGRRVRRRDPTRVLTGDPDDSLTGVGGLVGFGEFTRGLGLEVGLSKSFGDLKTGHGVVYPMGEQLRLLLDAIVADEDRIFGVEALAADRLFVHLAGGTIPSIDTIYRDLARFDQEHLARLEGLMAHHGMSGLHRSPSGLHVDIDTTVEPLFGKQEGALPGPNPRYRGRPSYHPILACIGETGTCIGAQLRPGDRGFGERDVPTVLGWLARLRQTTGPHVPITVRMDSAADCTELLCSLTQAGFRFVVKLKVTEDLMGHALTHESWRVSSRDPEGTPTERVAVLPFQRKEWAARGIGFRVVALRSTERCGGQQGRVWENSDEGTQFYVTNDWLAAPEDIPREYDGRAEVETIIRDLKHSLAIGKIPSSRFDANHAMFLLKLLAHNLLRRYAAAVSPRCCHWRTPWLRRLLIVRPGRLLRSGRRWTLRLPPNMPVLR